MIANCREKLVKIYKGISPVLIGLKEPCPILHSVYLSGHLARFFQTERF